MLLVLTTGSAWNSNYCTPEGQPIYKVESPFKLASLKTTIQKFIPNDGATGMQRFSHLAEIHFNAIHSDKIIMNGEEKNVNNLFRHGAWHRRDRIFVGPDGKEYIWKVGNTKPELFLNDEAQTPVAKFHREHSGYLHDACPASLEIFPIGEHMTDIIVVTFVYLEKLRQDDDDQASSSKISLPKRSERTDYQNLW